MRILSFVNLAGVLALAVLCVSQWQNGRRQDAEIDRLDTARIDQAAVVKERDSRIVGQVDDLKSNSEHIAALTGELKSVEGDLRVERTRNVHIEAERDQLEQSMKSWSEAVDIRDERIRENQEQLRELAANLNVTVLQYNELATNYNESVNLLNDRTAAYNDLVDRFNEAAKKR
jgi:chromosome segregation ATPase